MKKFLSVVFWFLVIVSMNSIWVEPALGEIISEDTWYFNYFSEFLEKVLDPRLVLRGLGYVLRLIVYGPQFLFFSFFLRK
jgi:hypothetical protein